MVHVHAERVPRISMGRMIAPTGEESGNEKYVLTLGKKGDSVSEQIGKALPILRKFSLPPEESLYADNEGALERFSSEVLKGAKKRDLADIIERIIDTRPFLGEQAELLYPRINPTSYDMRYDSNFIAPDIVPTAGLILSQDRRWIYDSSTESRFFTISQVMESYLLAAAVLRRAGLDAYPSTAVICPDGNEEIHKPILAVLDPSQPNSVLTFDLLRKHPLMGSLELISDSALWGVGHVMRAENQVKRLMADFFLAGNNGVIFDNNELESRAEEIASSLYQCHLLWQGCHFISTAFEFLDNEMYETSKVLLSNMIRADWDSFSIENPALAANPLLFEQYLHDCSLHSASILDNLTSSALSRMIMNTGDPGQALN